ncbi:hypothetical protein D514_0105330 [Microbacterium sp. UCD-TDU]|nr:hypothetical protein D514_0105330 [Microbacterium sp. UCD-TDU]
MNTVARSPRIVDGSRSVHPNGRFPTAALVVVGVLPLVPLLLAVVDARPGFRLVLLSLTVYAATLAVALWFWVRSMRERLIRIAETGPLRFAPPGGVRTTQWLIPMAGLLPAAMTYLVQILGLPTMSSRLLDWGPYLLAAVSLVSLGREVMSLRRPLGLAVDERGLHGVRRSAPLEASWEEIGTVTPVGPYGPKLAVSVAGRAPVIVDAHHLGSDPAAVAAVVSFFRDSPEQRIPWPTAPSRCARPRARCGAESARLPTGGSVRLRRPLPQLDRETFRVVDAGERAVLLGVPLVAALHGDAFGFEPRGELLDVGHAQVEHELLVGGEVVAVGGERREHGHARILLPDPGVTGADPEMLLVPGGPRLRVPAAEEEATDARNV